MAHQLTIRENGTAEMFSGNNETPWHKLGTIVAGKLNAAEAIKAAQLDWQVDLLPVYVEGKEVEGYKATTRNDNRKVLSIVGSRYNVIQNTDSFDFFDEVVGSGQAVYDTAGSLFEGRKVWIMAKLPGKLFIRNNPTDITEKNVLLYTSHDGSSGLSMQIVGTRVVCANTLSVAMGSATNQIKIRHTKSYAGKIEEAKKALELCTAYFNDLQEVMNILADQAMTSDEMVKFAEKLVPTSKEDISTRTENIRSELVGLFSRGKGNLGASRWDALNAVTEYCDHNRATRSGTEGNEAESRFAASLLGSGNAMKNRAMALLVP